MFFLFVFASKAFALHYALVISVTMFAFVYLKMLIREPRPYLVDPTLDPYSCSPQYGCPSGSSVRLTCALTSLYLDFVFSKRERMNPILFGFLSLVYIVLFLSGTLARLYLFAHTLN